MNERELFSAAVQIEDPAERSAYLDKACGDDAELRQRVEALLTAFAQAGSFLQQQAADAAATSDVPPAGPSLNSDPAEGPGGIIGTYKLLQQIGEGGMGTVFMAEQTHPVQRKVALKLIKSGMDSHQVIARFEAERQALALMDHPNIAKVLDAGTTQSGRPYFVMELVKGVPITKYCDEHHLPPRQRLELFVPVCQAVQHAHQKGIIHRDLKPSNVMVCLYDGKPVPKVIDFGVAKAAGARLTEKTLFTEIGQVVGTLEYMSPEQAELNQLDIDTRSDIYSLGVLLYELLTGTTPLERKRFKEVVFLEVLRLIREEELPRPSTRLSTTEGLPSIAANRGLEPKKLSGLMRGELDWIVMKTLEKDRNRRYETANGLAMDVQRYLADEAVQACPPSAWYRFRKFSRRNKAALTTAALVAAALIVGTGVSLWQAVRANDALNAERQTQSTLDKERKEKDQQKSRIDSKINEALMEAAGLREKARAAGPTHGKSWADLREAGKQAETLAASELADPALVHRVRTFLAGLKQDEADRRMLAKLEDIRIRQNLRTSSAEAADNPYRGLFQEYGLPILDMKEKDAVEKIVASPIRDSLVMALDGWATWGNNPGGIHAGLLGIAQKACNDPWRRKYFDARLRKDQVALMELARQPETLTQDPLFIVSFFWSMDGPNHLPRDSFKLLQQAQMRYPADLWINYFLGSYHDPKLPAGDTIGFCRAALAVRPEKLEIYYLLASAFKGAQRYDEAVAVFQHVLAVFPNEPARASVEMNICRGQALEKKGKLDDAIEVYKETIRLLKPTNGLGYDLWVRQFLASALEKKGLPEKGIVVLRDGMRAWPDLPPIVQAIFQEDFAKKAKPAQILAVYRRVGNSMTDKGFSEYGYLGDALTTIGLVDDAIAVYREAVRLDPKNPHRYNQLALSLQTHGEVEKAIAAYREMLRHLPDPSPVLQAMGKEDFAKHVRATDVLFAYRLAYRCLPEKGVANPAADASFGYARLGDTLVKIGLLDEAIAAWRESTRVYRDYSTMQKLAGALGQKGLVQEAADAWRIVIRIGGSQATDYHYAQFASMLIKSGKLEEAICLKADYSFAHQTCDMLQINGLLDKAIDVCREGIGKRPDEVCFKIVLSMALERQVKLEEALAVYSEWIRREPKSGDALARRGALHQRLGQGKLALADYSRATEVAPEHAPAWLNRASYYVGLAQWDKAAADFSKLIVLTPKDWSAWYGRSNAYFQLKQWDKAAADSTQVIELNPNTVLGWANRGAALNNMGQYEKGVADNSRAIELYPNYSLAWNNRGFALERLGRWEKAAADYAKAQELGYTMPSVWIGWARCQSRLGRYQAVVAKLEKAPTYPAVLNELAWLLATCPDAKFRDARRAVALADKAVKMLPTEGMYWNTLGVARYRAGDWKAAAEALTKSMELRKGGDSNDWFFLAMAQKRLDKTVEARKLFDRATAWMENNRPNDEQLRRFRAEAAELLGVKEK